MANLSQLFVENVEARGIEPVGVLVVDSDPAVRRTLESGLAHTGYRVQSAESPAQAVLIARNNGISALLFEVTPETGFTVEALFEVVSLCSPSVVVCSSENTSPQLVMECARRGGSGFLPVSFSRRASIAATRSINSVSGGTSIATSSPRLVSMTWLLRLTSSVVSLSISASLLALKYL